MANPSLLFFDADALIQLFLANDLRVLTGIKKKLWDCSDYRSRS
jgi:hypothetical protein